MITKRFTVTLVATLAVKPSEEEAKADRLADLDQVFSEAIGKVQSAGSVLIDGVRAAGLEIKAGTLCVEDVVPNGSHLLGSIGTLPLGVRSIDTTDALLAAPSPFAPEPGAEDPELPPAPDTPTQS